MKAKKVNSGNGNGRKTNAGSCGTKKNCKKQANGNGNKASAKSCPAGIKKQYLKTSELCNVTFRLPKAAAPEAHTITIVGDFNSWNVTETPMKKLKSGDFKVTMKLPRGNEYRYRYFIDTNRWENDWNADDYVPNAYGCDDSLVKV